MYADATVDIQHKSTKFISPERLKCLVERTATYPGLETVELVDASAFVYAGKEKIHIG